MNARTRIRAAAKCLFRSRRSGSDNLLLIAGKADRQLADPVLLMAAIADMADALSDVAPEVGRHFNCGEADRIAEVLALAGHAGDAAAWLGWHACGDDEGDQHQHLRTVDGPRWDAARQYVAEMFGRPVVNRSPVQPI